MRILFMMAQAYLPRQAGGVQVVTKQLVDAFASLGHDAAVAAEMSFKGASGMKSAAGSLLGRSFSRDHHGSQLVFRARRISTKAGAILRAFKPDCVIVQSMDAMPLSKAVSDRGVPLVICWHDVYVGRAGGRPANVVARYVANSHFTASVYETEFGLRSVVIPPLVRPEMYETTRGEDGSVTFINPVPDKGVEVAIEVAARCPDIPFEFVESWILESGPRRRLLKRLSALPNVRFTPHQSDVRPVYQRTRLLLAPSQVQEGWGRVASEAQVSGIPAIGSRSGGLVESIGPGGILIDPHAPASAWCEAVRSVWGDRGLYRRLSASARAYSRRRELDPSWGVDRMLAEVRAAIALRPVRATAMPGQDDSRRSRKGPWPAWTPRRDEPPSRAA